MTPDDDLTNGSPIACTLVAMDDGQRRRHQSAIQLWRHNVQEVVELSDGYAFRLPPDESTCLAVAEFMTLERLCCPFLGFGLEIAPDGGPMWLRLTGREGVKSFLRSTFAAG